MMMGLTPERRKELRELARQHNEKQVAEKTEVKAVPETPVSSHDRRKHSRRQSPHLPLQIPHRKRWGLSLFP
ncbi:hypothetical protein NXW98_22375 [Bacteroides caccae]|nr:hypothetical protein [Bacteroides caccae]MCS3193863.1 hypothetical protein [Bacteroides caccae]